MIRPAEVPVMTLPGATLFPRAMLPLRIFEPRYKRMLADCLESNRVFAVALQKPGTTREIPFPVAGLGLIRVAVTNPDGTSNLILQGIGRVLLGSTVRYKPYRVSNVDYLDTTGGKTAATSRLTAQVLELVAERFKDGLNIPFNVLQQLTKAEDEHPAITPDKQKAVKHVLSFLSEIEDPEQFTDIVSCTLLTFPPHRQIIMESLHLEKRLENLVTLLSIELDRQNNDGEDA